MEKQNWLKKNPKRTWLFIYLILIIILVGVLKLIDGYKGYLFYKDNYELRTSKTRYIRLREHQPLQHKIYSPEEFPLNKNKNVVFQTDYDGFIASPKSNHISPDLQIFFVGGSTTECSYVDEKNRFPSLVGQLLEDSLKLKINTFNAGVSGNHTLHSLNILINKIIPYRPDFIVLLQNANDVGIFYNERTYWNDNPSRSLIMDSAVFKAYMPSENFPFIPNLARALEFRLDTKPKAEFDDVKIPLDTPTVELFKEEYSKAILSFIQVCMIYDIQPILMTQFAQYENSDLQNLHDEFNAILKQTAIDNSISYIDLQAMIQSNSEKYVYDELHLNDLGSMESATFISDELISIIEKKRITEE